MRGAEGIDDDCDALALELVVALLGAAVEAEAVLEAGAAAALDSDAEDRDVGLLGHQAADLRRRRGRARDQHVGALLELHRFHRTNEGGGHKVPLRAGLCNSRLTVPDAVCASP